MDADRFVLGYTNPSIHIIMDEAVKWMGAGHRSINHSSKTIAFIKNLFSRKEQNIAILHLLIDNHIINKKYLQSCITKHKTYQRNKKIPI